jgi:hypothetical protein
MTITPSILSVNQIDSSGFSIAITEPISPVKGFQIEVKKLPAGYFPLSNRNKLETGYSYMLFVGSAAATSEGVGTRNTNRVFLDGYSIGDQIQFRVRNLDLSDVPSAWVESQVYEVAEQTVSYVPQANTPTNFNFYTNEFNTFNSIANEIIQMRGIPVYYLPRQFQKVDLILGEDVLSKFNQSFPMKMYLASHSEFGGDGSMFAQFGLTVDEQATFEVNIEQFFADTGNLTPIEGDLVYVPVGNLILEVFYVNDADPFFHMGKVSKFTLNCRKYEYTNEEMDTGIDNLDELDSLNSTDIDSENDELEDELNDILNSTEPNIFGDR